MDESILVNMIVELRRGTQIISVLSQLEKNQYGYSLLQSLDGRGVKMEAGTLYPLLRRLESQGLLSSEWDTTESRPRKYYVLSQEGKQILKQLKEEWKEIVREMNSLIVEDK